MININLPGNLKTKKIVLIILIIMAIIIIFHNGFMNKQSKRINNGTIEKEAVIEPRESISYESKEQEMYDKAYDLFFFKSV